PITFYVAGCRVGRRRVVRLGYRGSHVLVARLHTLRGGGLALVCRFGALRLRTAAAGRVGSFVGTFVVGVFLKNNTCRVAHRRGVGGYRFDHHRVGTYARVFAHGEAAQNLGASPHHHTALKG